jgi:hypothetical protein
MAVPLGATVRFVAPHVSGSGVWVVHQEQEGATVEPIVEAIVLGVAIGAVALVLSGVRRLPWEHAVLVGLGIGLVFGAFRLAAVGGKVEPDLLVLIGALGGSLATAGSERGERARAGRTAAEFGGDRLDSGS